MNFSILKKFEKSSKFTVIPRRLIVIDWGDFMKILFLPMKGRKRLFLHIYECMIGNLKFKLYCIREFKIFKIKKESYLQQTCHLDVSESARISYYTFYRPLRKYNQYED